MTQGTPHEVTTGGALGHELLSCFQRASSEGRSEVAEHLLVALEPLSKDYAGAADPKRHAQLGEPYRSIVHLARTTASSRQIKDVGT